MAEEQLKDYALADMEKILKKRGKSLKNYSTLSFPDLALMEIDKNRMINDELGYDRVFLKQEHIKLLSALNDEQKNVYETVMNVVLKDEGGVFFVYGYGGTGKTFVWRTLCAALRSKGEIVLSVASSGIASLLIPGGRTAHSKFGIPLVINEDSTCNIKQGSDLANLIAKSRLIIWDEAPMMHKHCFEALDRTFRDVLRFSNQNSMSIPFGDKVIVFGGDFRQILPVIPKGVRQQIVSASLNSSYLWNFCKVLKLSKNMRLQSGNSNEEREEMRTFAEWILKIGDGLIGEENDGVVDFEIPDDILIKDSENPIGAIVDNTYPNLIENSRDDNFLQERAILAPTLEIVGIVNDYIMSFWPGEEITYRSSDSICKADDNSNIYEDAYTPEYLNNISSSGLPNHKLTLKVGVSVMLLRNIDQSSGLCNGTRLRVSRLGKHVIEAEIISGQFTGKKVFIPRWF